MVIRWSGFGNVGRDQSEKRSSKRVDTDALEALRDALPDERAAAFLCEINEGDDNNEMKLARQIFKGWRLYGSNTREPILLSPDNPPARARVFWVPNTAVALWSPPRSVLVVDLADEPTTLLGSHPAAGANGQGKRPAHALEPLQDSWDAVTEKRRLIKQRKHKAGRNIIELLDANAYNHRIQRQPTGEQVVWNQRTDWGLVYPAADYRALFHYGKQIDFRVDTHNGHVMRGFFPPKNLNK